MTALDINKLHRKGGLLEGAITSLRRHPDPCRPLPPSGRNYDDLVAEIDGLHWRDQLIEWIEQPIIEKNPPPSWRGRARARPKFVCGCGRGAYRLHLGADGRFSCAACSGYVRPSRISPRDPLGADFAKLAKLRAQLKIAGLFDDPNISRPAKNKPRSIWLWRRMVQQLRSLELSLGQRLGNVVSARLYGGGRAMGSEPGEPTRAKGRSTA
jgi:hypothetical protein